MSSKMVTDDSKTGIAVIEAARTYAPHIAALRAEQYANAGVAHAPSAAVIEAGIRCDADVLETTAAELADANKALTAELADDVAVTARRDRYAAETRAGLVDFRESVQTNCGDAAVAEMGFDGDTPRDPVLLAQLGATVLENVATKPPKATKKGVKFDAKVAVEGLDASVKGLEKANADAIREKREEQHARGRRDAVWAVYERELSTAADRLDAMLRAVGLDHEADRLMPTKHAAPAAATTAPTNGAAAAPANP